MSRRRERNQEEKTKGEGVEGYTLAADVAGEGKGILCIQSKSRSLCSGLVPPVDTRQGRSQVSNHNLFWRGTVE